VFPLVLAFITGVAQKEKNRYLPKGEKREEGRRSERHARPFPPDMWKRREKIGRRAPIQSGEKRKGKGRGRPQPLFRKEERSSSCPSSLTVRKREKGRKNRDVHFAALDLKRKGNQTTEHFRYFREESKKGILKEGSALPARRTGGRNPGGRGVSTFRRRTGIASTSISYKSDAKKKRARVR